MATCTTPSVIAGNVGRARLRRVRPHSLVGNRLKLHTILAFIAIVGGLVVFGAAGVILGPVTLTVTMQLLEIWRRRSNEIL